MAAPIAKRAGIPTVRARAMKYYRKALAVDPDFPSAVQALKELQQR